MNQTAAAHAVKTTAAAAAAANNWRCKRAEAGRPIERRAGAAAGRTPHHLVQQRQSGRRASRRLELLERVILQLIHALGENHSEIAFVRIAGAVAGLGAALLQTLFGNTVQW